jgi:hypothetical protein
MLCKTPSTVAIPMIDRLPDVFDSMWEAVLKESIETERGTQEPFTWAFVSTVTFTLLSSRSPQNTLTLFLTISTLTRQRG